MRQGPIRAYADTSVYGGVFDAMFSKASEAFFDQVRSGRFGLVTSALLEAELEDAPEQVKALFDEAVSLAEHASISQEATRLQQAYLAEGIVTPLRGADALHVALASVAGCSILVSWNFRHIVQFAKIRLYNAVNALLGYDPIAIHSPPEVIGYDPD